MAVSTSAAPAVISPTSLGSIRVEPLTSTIGAELSNVNLGIASRDPGLVAEIRALLLKHKVLFFRDQEITRAEHVAFARHFGELEDHPVAGSDPDNPGLVRIYKSPDAPMDRYENSWHTDATWREKPPFGCVPASEVSDQPGVCSRVSGALALASQQHGHVGQPLHAALRGDGLPAVPP